MPWQSILVTVTHEKGSDLARLANLSGLLKIIGLSKILVASGAYLVGAYVLAVAAVRLSPRGWFGRQLRKYLWLIPFSPLVIVCAAGGLLLKQLAAGVGFVAMGFRRLFEKATGHQTYQRQRRYSKYYYKNSRHGTMPDRANDCLVWISHLCRSLMRQSGFVSGNRSFQAFSRSRCRISSQAAKALRRLDFASER